MTSSTNGIYGIFENELNNGLFKDLLQRRLSSAGTELSEFLSEPLNSRNALKLAQKISQLNRKDKIIGHSLTAMEMSESLLGNKIANHRKHLTHSVNVFLLGLVLVSNIPKLKNLLLFIPGEQIDKPKPNTDNLSEYKRLDEFMFRWLMAAYYHDIGYYFELQAKSTSMRRCSSHSGRDNPCKHWIEMWQQNIDRQKYKLHSQLRSYAHLLRHLDILQAKPGDSNHLSGRWGADTPRVVKEDTDILKLMSYLIGQTVGKRLGSEDKIFEELFETFANSFQNGVGKSFDHGKYGAFLLLNILRDTYARSRRNLQEDELSRFAAVFALAGP